VTLESLLAIHSPARVSQILYSAVVTPDTTNREPRHHHGPQSSTVFFCSLWQYAGDYSELYVLTTWNEQSLLLFTISAAFQRKGSLPTACFNFGTFLIRDKEDWFFMPVTKAYRRTWTNDGFPRAVRSPIIRLLPGMMHHQRSSIITASLSDSYLQCSNVQTLKRTPTSSYIDSITSAGSRLSRHDMRPWKKARSESCLSIGRLASRDHPRVWHHSDSISSRSLGLRIYYVSGPGKLNGRH
jgi:hypothetical protein